MDDRVTIRLPIRHYLDIDPAVRDELEHSWVCRSLEYGHGRAEYVFVVSEKTLTKLGLDQFRAESASTGPIPLTRALPPAAFGQARRAHILSTRESTMKKGFIRWRG